MSINEHIAKANAVLQSSAHLTSGDLILGASTPTMYFALGALTAACFKSGMPIEAMHVDQDESVITKITLRIPLQWVLNAAISTNS